MSYYSLDGIKTDLTKTLCEKKELLKAWEAVTFPTKKNGEPFAVFSKNFSGAKYAPWDYAMQPNENRLTVCAFSKNSGYVSDHISMYCHVKQLDEKKKAKTENFCAKIPCLEQIYKYDLEDAKEAIADHIEFLKGQIENYEKQIEIADHAYWNFKEAHDIAVKNLLAEVGKPNTLYYGIIEVVAKRGY